MAYHGKGQYAEAVAALRKAMALSDNPWLKALLIHSLARTGERQEAVKLLNELQAESARHYVSSSALAIAYGSLGEKDKAFAFLEKDVAERASRPQVFSINPIWDDLRDDPRFAELVRRVEAAKME
jgi:Flp pilus assembly protein TadD